jgi:hypothetical protein
MAGTPLWIVISSLLCLRLGWWVGSGRGSVIHVTRGQSLPGVPNCDGKHCVPDWARLSPRKESWRGNHFVRDNGLLLYIACRHGVDWPRTSARFNYTSRDVHDITFEDTYELLLVGASMFGMTEESGRPVRVDVVEIMVHARCITCGLRDSSRLSQGIHLSGPIRESEESSLTALSPRRAIDFLSREVLCLICR